MNTYIDPFTRDPRAGTHALLGREIGATRIEHDDFLVHQTEEVVRNLLVAHFPPSSSEADGDSPFHPFHFPDFDPANPLIPSVTATQKYAVKMLLGIESHKAQDTEREVANWIRTHFDKALDDPELSCAHCFEEVWKLLRQLYLCGEGRIIIDFYVNNLSRKNKIRWQEQLREFIREVAQPDLLAAKPVALELMMFAANPFCCFFRLAEDFRIMEVERARDDPVYSEALSYCLTSRLASLGVPLAEDLLIAKMLSYAEESGDWSRLDGVCEKLAKTGNRVAQEYFLDALIRELNHVPQTTQDLDRLEQKLNWLIRDCPVTSCESLARALETGEMGPLKISLGAEERFDLLKQRFSLGDEFAGNSLLEIYTSNRLGNRSLNLSPLERVEAIRELAESPSSYFVRRSLTIIYNVNRIGESTLPFSLEERYERIEALARKRCMFAAHIVLKIYLNNQLSLPGELLFESPPPMEIEREQEVLPLNLTHQERVEKLYDLAVMGYVPAIDALFNYLGEHGRGFDFKDSRSLLFELLIRYHDARRARRFLSLSENQIEIIDLLSSFHISLFGERDYPFRF